MILSIKLKNFKRFSDFSINFAETKRSLKPKKLILLYGENGAGKSSIVDSLGIFSTLPDMLLFALTNESDAEKETRPLFTINKLLEYKQIGSLEPMELSFSGLLNNRLFDYSVGLSNDSFISESLSVDGKPVFFVGGNSMDPVFSNAFFGNGVQDQILRIFEMYYGKFPFLACMKYALFQMNDSFVEQHVAKEVLSLLSISDRMFFSDDRGHFADASYTVNEKLLPNLVMGEYDDSIKPRIMESENSLTQFLKEFFPRLVRVKYQISGNEDKKMYHLVLVEKQRNKEIEIPYRFQSRGTRKLISIFSSIVNARFQNDTLVVIDEVDSSISQRLLADIITSIDDSSAFKGQLIMTSHNPFLLSNRIKKGCYSIKDDESGVVVADSLDSYGRKIQPNTDMSGQFMKNKYGTVPEASIENLYKILTNFAKTIDDVDGKKDRS